MPTLGNKHECFNCGIKFYDLGRSEIVCPSCGTAQSESGNSEEPEQIAPKAPTVAPPEPDPAPDPVAAAEPDDSDDSDDSAKPAADDSPADDEDELEVAFVVEEDEEEDEDEDFFDED